jgi:chaperonin GroEL
VESRKQDMAKQVSFDEASRQALEKGVNALADAIKIGS